MFERGKSSAAPNLNFRPGVLVHVKHSVETCESYVKFENVF